MRNRGVALLIVASILLVGCAGGPPREPENLCAIFAEKPEWHSAARKAEKRWGAPLAIPMAIMYQESGFRSDVRPPVRWFLGIIPLGRGSSAFGYSQAQTPAWNDYQDATGNGWADRDDFADAMDFIQWYMDRSQRLNGAAKTDAYTQYLNYHEGWGGYRRGSYRSKPGLQAIARKVSARADRYGRQYAGCRKDLQQSWLKRLLG